jgi:hypothetical protein
LRACVTPARKDSDVLVLSVVLVAPVALSLTVAALLDAGAPVVSALTTMAMLLSTDEICMATPLGKKPWQRLLRLITKAKKAASTY